MNFIFRIGVILAVYNFLWWLIMLGINILRGGRPKQLFDIYFIKTIRYVFLADVIFLFCIKQAGGLILLNDLLLGGLILLIYFLGKIQSKQQRQSLFSVSGRANLPGMSDILNKIKPAFDIRFEIGVVVLALLVFIGFYFSPQIASNTISNWFLSSILNIEDTPVFGFMFKIVGFFFMLSVLLKITNAIMAILLGKPKQEFGDDEPTNRFENNNNNDDDDHFDDYTEVK
ncbi:hypothetical protein [Brumimicrobium mesophilum]|uniref:hypothetical protein n=1 Tax=Brumimicrobium mesophilum TaxID=392717 RepID=UPI00131C82B4|nr:hypothetical protein [Brumimicrobium mesophilum]